LSCQSPDGGGGEQLAVANFWPRIALILILFASAPFYDLFEQTKIEKMSSPAAFF
jgi:hypothetical protein